MALFYGIYKTTHGTWRTTGPHGGYEIAWNTTQFFAKDREFEILTEEEFKEKVKKGEISDNEYHRSN